MDVYNKLTQKLIKAAKDDKRKIEVMAILNNIMQILKDKHQYQTMQQEVGVDMIFRGYIVENWFKNTLTNKYKALNKIIVYEYIGFYNQYQK